MHLVVLHGPPAVGKMTVGLALERLTGLPLFHNHRTIDVVLPFFPFGSPPFARLVGQFRRRVLEEVAGSDLPGLIFTFVWAFDDERDRVFLEEATAPFAARGAGIAFVELEATLEERLRRNETELRLTHKPTKRDLSRSREDLLRIEGKHRTCSGDAFPWPDRHLRIDNTSLSPEAVAERIVARFGLPLA